MVARVYMVLLSFLLSFGVLLILYMGTVVGGNLVSKSAIMVLSKASAIGEWKWGEHNNAT